MWFHRSWRDRAGALWNTVDPAGTTKVAACWEDGLSSTIHSPYHHYNLEMTRMPKEEVGTT